MRGFVRQVLTVLGVAVATLAWASPSFAGLQMWDFQSWNHSLTGSGTGNSLNLTSSDGTSLTVTAWSDSASVESAEVVWSNSSALGVRNRFEGTGLPDSSVDSLTSSATGGYDMLLLEFDTEVALDGLDLNWAVGGGSLESTDLSILAWDGLGSGDLGGSWADILLGNGGGYDVVGNFSDVDLSYFSLGNTGVTSSKWLIGAYNPVFGAGGDAGDDGFALASLSTMSAEEYYLTNANEVPIPGTVALMLLGLCLTLLYRRELAVPASA